MAQVANKTCEICIMTSGFHYCMDCEQLFCEDCKTSHLRSKACRNHQFLTGSDIQPKPKVLCAQHSEEYIFYCVPCDSPVCKRCMTDSHNSHKIQELHTVVTDIKSNLEYQIYEKFTILQSSLVNVKEESGLFMKDIENTINSIQQQGEGLKKAVDKEVKELVQSLRERSSKETVELSSSIKKFRNSLDEVEMLKRAYQDASGVKDDARALETLNKIMTDCNDIEIYQISKLPLVGHGKTTIHQSDIRKLLGTLTYHDYRQQKDTSKIVTDKYLQETPDKSKTVCFDVSFKPNEDTEKLGLQGIYILRVSNVCLILENVITRKPILKWPYTHLRKYGIKESDFIIVSGRRSESGEGLFIFIHEDPTKIIKAIDSITKRKT